VVMADHRVLTQGEVDAHGGKYCAVLTMVDIATRNVVFVAVDSLSATATAVAVLTRWVPYYGLMDLFITDPHSGFTGNVMAEIWRILGVKGEAKPQGDKGGVAVVERKHVNLNRILADGFTSGEIDNDKKLELYLGFAQVEENQMIRSGQVSHFALWTGQDARTTDRLLMTDGLEKGWPSVINDEDGAIVACIAGRCGELVKLVHEWRDEKSRQNAMRRDKQMGVSALSTRFDIRVDDEASFNGDAVKVVALEYGTEGEAVTAVVSRDGGEPVKVRYSALKPLASPMPVKNVILEKPVVGAFVVGRDQQGLVEAGVVERVMDGMCVWRCWKGMILVYHGCLCGEM